MSSTKFASITAGLLARKGEAMPWVQGGNHEAEQAPPVWRQPPLVMAPRAPAPAATPTTPPPEPPKEKSCSIRMSAHDYERLGIIAVKTGVSRQQLLKDALAQFLAGQARQHGCLCLKDGAETCGAGCGC